MSCISRGPWQYRCRRKPCFTWLWEEERDQGSSEENLPPFLWVCMGKEHAVNSAFHWRKTMKKIKQKLRFLSFADLFSHHEDKQSCRVLGEHFTDGGSPWYLRKISSTSPHPAPTDYRNAKCPDCNKQTMPVLQVFAHSFWRTLLIRPHLRIFNSFFFNPLFSSLALS